MNEDLEPIDLSPTQNRCIDAGARGIACANGVMVANHSVSIGRITDGTTFTIMIGEQSGWGRDGSGNPVDIRNCLSSTRAWMGAKHPGWPGGPHSSQWASAGEHYMTTTVRHPIGHRLSNSAVGSHWQGVNTSILSAHRGGAFVLRADGGTKFLTDGTDIGLLRQLAVRDDRRIIRDNPLE